MLASIVTIEVNDKYSTKDWLSFWVIWSPMNGSLIAVPAPRTSVR